MEHSSIWNPYKKTCEVWQPKYFCMLQPSVSVIRFEAGLITFFVYTCIPTSLQQLEIILTVLSFRYCNHIALVSGVAQSVQCLTTDWTTGTRSPEEVKDFSSSLCVQTSFDAHPASYPMCTGGPFPGSKARRGVTLTTHPTYCLGKEWVESIPPFPRRARMAQWDSFTSHCSVFKWLKMRLIHGETRN
jgi:hypothetical protein